MTDGKVKESVEKQITKEGLPREAFTIIGSPDDPETWQLPHHKKGVSRASGVKAIEKTVDWEIMPAAVATLSPRGYPGKRLKASPEQILRAAKHLADHYREASKPLPDILAALA